MGRDYYFGAGKTERREQEKRCREKEQPYRVKGQQCRGKEQPYREQEKQAQSGTTDRLGHHICDYRDTDYHAFWADGARDYEDAVERIALRRLVRPISGSCLEIGAGYGRLVNEYADRCDSILLTDYAENLLEQARRRVSVLGLEQAECKVWNLYELDRLEQQFDNAVCVRVLHHVEDVPEFFRQVNLALRDGGYFILEFANKRNLLEILRWTFRRHNIAPFDRRPTARKDDVYYNFHPDYIRGQLWENGFVIEKELSVSLFRSKVLKHLIPAKWLAAVEKPLQGGPWKLSPSIFVRARKIAAESLR